MDPLIQAIVANSPMFAGLVWLGVSQQRQLAEMRKEAAEDREFMKQLIFVLLAAQGISPTDAVQAAAVKVPEDGA